MTYKPTFICKHCGRDIESKVHSSSTIGGLAHGYLPLCGCKASMKAQEAEHRARIEARKRARRGIYNKN